MNKTAFQITATLALALAVAGCHKGGKLDKPSAFTTPTGPVQLKLKWPTGEHVIQEMDMKQAMQMSMPSQPAPIKQSMTMGQKYSLTVLQATPDGGHEIEMEFLGTRMGMEMGGRTMLAYDSGKTSADAKPNPMADVLGKMVGAKIQYYLDASNTVTRVAGVDDLLARLSEGGQNVATAALKSTFNEGYFKNMMSSARFMPTKPVQPGDTWPVQQEVPLAQLGTMELNYTFTLVCWEMHGERNCARMEFQGDITSKPGQEPGPAGMSMSIQNGTLSGVAWFDPEIGMTIDTTINSDMQMNMTVPMRGQTMSMTNQLNQAINIKLDSVN